MLNQRIRMNILYSPKNQARSLQRVYKKRPLSSNIVSVARIQTLHHAIIIIMDVGNISLYKERWKAVEEIERQELRAMTLEEHWRKLNAIARFAIETGMEKDQDKEDGEMKVFLRWAEIKSQYEAG